MVHNLTTIFSFQLITEWIFIFEHHCFFFPSFSEYHGFCRKLLSICHGLARMLIARLKWSNKRTQPIPVHSEKNTKELGRMKNYLYGKGVVISYNAKTCFLVDMWCPKIQQTKMLVLCQMFGDFFFIWTDLAVFFNSDKI